ncbi:MAG: nitrous oxide reductase family maturation protein NosD, partial [Deltaproteobacteria bacterium]|nr:nitrous oxide reductase family maturation protein NosD [Deltaproteobacteria bacterium]
MMDKVSQIKFIFNALILMMVFGTITSQLLAAEQPSLSDLIEQTPVGGVVPLQPGETYYGPVIITKSVILDGQNQITIDGKEQRTILTLKADGITVKNLRLINSGDSHDRVDAAIHVRSSNNKIQNNIIRDTLFGIDFQEAHNNLITGNDIASKDVHLGVRGDGIRVWASHKNIFRHNKIHDSRDMVIWYSNDNLIEENEGWNNRYSLHFMFAGGNTVRNNRYHHNTVGIFLMYSREALVEGNEVRYSTGGTGVGIGLKEADNMTIRFNKMIYCKSGMYFDLSPYQPDAYNLILGNVIAYNIDGLEFNSGLPRNVFKGNAFIDNLELINIHGNGSAQESIWEGNFYSEFEGFDRNNDEIGDSEFTKRAYLDTIWMNDNWMHLFYGSPVLSVINLLARLAPISEPRELFTDSKPVFYPDSPVLRSENNILFVPPKIKLSDEHDEFEGLDYEMSERFQSNGDDDDDDDDD